MATKTLYATADARTVTTPSSLGAGACDHLPVGSYSGYNYASHLRFSYNWADIPSAGSITGATLYLRTTSYHTALSSNTVRVRRTQSFTEGTASHPMTSTNGGGVTGSSRPTVLDAGVTFSGGTSTNTWRSVSVTSQVVAEYGNANFYFMLDTTSGVCEFSSRETSYDPYLVISYNPNSAPTAPTSLSPSGGSLQSSQTPTVSFNHNDPDGDACASWDLEVYNTTGNGAAVGTLQQSYYNQTSDLTNPIQKTLTTLTRGNWYVWRARTADATNGDGAWSSWAYFKVHGNVTATLTNPSGANQWGRMYKTPGSGDASPRFYPSWTFSCPEGGYQSSASITFNGGSTQNVTGSATSVKVTTHTPTRNSLYTIAMTAVCNHGVTSGGSSWANTRAQWGQASFYIPTGGATTYGAANPSSVKNDGDVILEYAASAGTGLPAESAWRSSTAALSANDYLHYRVTLLGWGNSQPTGGKLYSLTANYDTSVPSPKWWSLTSSAALEVGQFLFGTQCLKVTQHATANQYGYMDLEGLQTGTDYMFSVYVKADVGANYLIRLFQYNSSSVEYASTSIDNSGTNNEWKRISLAWNSGENDRVRIYIGSLNTAGYGGTTGAVARFDAAKLEASTVVNPWTPGGVGKAVSVDAGGIQIDESKGGVFRLLGDNTWGQTSIDLNSGGGLHIDFDPSTDVSLSSQANPFQLGPTTGANLVMDGNEIIARNNGAASTLYLNNEGGNVQTAGSVLATGTVRAGGATGGDTSTGVMLRDTGGIEMYGSTPYIDFKNANEDYDVRLIRTGDDLLEVTGGGLKVNGSLTTTSNRPWRYVPLSSFSEFVSINSSTADDASPVAVEVTAIPANTAVAIEVIAYFQNTAGTSGSAHGLLFNYQDSDQNPAAIDLYGVAGVNGQYQSMRGLVMVGGTNGRQVYRRFLPGSNTCSFLARVIGYWVEC